MLPLVVTLLVVLISSCSKTVRFNISPVVPSAVGTVKFTTDNNKNMLMVLTVENLVDPSRLTPSKKTYIVWTENEDRAVRNLGRLVSSEAYFSTERNAKFSSPITTKPVRVFVTAENSADVQQPGNVTVLTTSNF